jgi:hypothetical protein
MKPTDFLPEKHSIGQAAINMHVDHEIQMAREECYHAATSAMELHRMLKHVSEEEGLQAWASEKITLANDYLRTVKEWLEYEIMTKLEQGVAENNPAPVVAPVVEPAAETAMLEDDSTLYHLFKNGSPLVSKDGNILEFRSLDSANKTAARLMEKPWNRTATFEARKKMKEMTAGASGTGGIAVAPAADKKMIKRVAK